MQIKDSTGLQRVLRSERSTENPNRNAIAARLYPGALKKDRFSVKMILGRQAESLQAVGVGRSRCAVRRKFTESPVNDFVTESANNGAAGLQKTRKTTVFLGKMAFAMLRLRVRSPSAPLSLPFFEKCIRFGTKETYP
jgi:hypothetical protein